MIQVTPVILCGGSGTRLWPLSRTGFPKQFLCLTGQDSLFQQAATRLAQLSSADITVSAPLLVVCVAPARPYLVAAWRCALQCLMHVFLGWHGAVVRSSVDLVVLMRIGN